MAVTTMTANELRTRLQKGEHIELIDVRTPVEFREVHVACARNVPLDVLDPQKLQAEREARSGEPLYVVCKSGGRGKQACEKLLAAGWSNVINVEGGTLACVEAGIEVVRGKKAISLERQVRIAAGMLVLTGSALGYFVDINWIGLAAFVGAGLVFAGVTDTCGMAIMLGRMPWNQVGSSPSPTSCARS